MDLLNSKQVWAAVLMVAAVMGAAVLCTPSKETSMVVSTHSTQGQTRLVIAGARHRRSPETSGAVWKTASPVQLAALQVRGG
jgi:hypothetical protein